MRGQHFADFRFFPITPRACILRMYSTASGTVHAVSPMSTDTGPIARAVLIARSVSGATDPPTFTLFSNKELPATWLRYIERSLREAFDLGATPIKLRVRRRSD